MAHLESDLLTHDAAGLRSAVAKARDVVTAIRIFQPHIAIILGSGLGPLADRVTHATSIAFARIPHFTRTHAVGHTGRLVLGYLAGLPVAVLQGRSHRYEGYSNAELGFPVRCLHALGARSLIVTNAAGGLNPRYRAGDLMSIDSHIDFLWDRRLRSTIPSHHTVLGPAAHEPVYDVGLIRRAQAAARESGIALHQGCYLATLGPTYETRSEYRMFRWMGADAVGMSTLPEVYAAWELGMQVLAFSVITNVASTDVPVSTTHQEVVEMGNAAGPKLMEIVHQVLEERAAQPD